jgi:hypothetical protein
MQTRYLVTLFRPGSEHQEDVSIISIKGVSRSEIEIAKADARDGACAEVTAADGTVWQIICVDADGYQVERAA